MYCLTPGVRAPRGVQEPVERVGRAGRESRSKVRIDVGRERDAGAANVETLQISSLTDTSYRLKGDKPASDRADGAVLRQLANRCRS